MFIDYIDFFSVIFYADNLFSRNFNLVFISHSDFFQNELSTVLRYLH